MGVIKEKDTPQPADTPIPPHPHTPILHFSGPPTRLDLWLAAQRPAHSRARWQELIRTGDVRVNGRTRKPHGLLREGDRVSWTIPAPRIAKPQPEDIPLDILYEDDDLIVLNKPAGLVVHPAPGHDSGTLVNALLNHCNNLPGIGGERRPGIVHRLDRDTSGVLVAAKSELAMRKLAAQFKRRQVRKEYVALAWGAPRPPRGTIDTLVGRSPYNRKKMSARPQTGRRAVTHYDTEQAFGEVSLLRLRIETGRTHQIRVHLAHIGHPVVGDTQYGRARKTERPVPATRQMLHAERLAFAHPRTGAALEFSAPLPEDMRGLLAALNGK